jgi:hypothetical protein
MSAISGIVEEELTPAIMPACRPKEKKAGDGESHD